MHLLPLCVGAIASAICFSSAAIPAETDGACLDGASETAAKVEDARALRLADDRLVRLAGVESFALLSVDSGEAEAALQKRVAALITGKAVQVRLLSEKPDRYGRLPALLGSGGEPLLQVVLAREGLAVASATGEAVPCFAAILSAEDEARRLGRGFWTQARVLRATPKSLAGRIGRFAIFEGRVLSVGNRRTRTYLNFGNRWSSDVTVDIEDDDRKAFGGEAALAAMAGARIRVRGYVEERGGPAVTVTSPMQIETLARTAATEE